MATQEKLKISSESQQSLVRYVNACCESFKRKADFRNKMELIDISYARFKQSQIDKDGKDSSRDADQQCGIGLNDVSVPIVVSQVDSFVGYLADVFLSGYPIFPVASTPKYKAQAEQLEAIIDNHSILAQTPRHLLMALRDGIKYNFMGVEVDWCPVKQYSVLSSYKDVLSGPKTQSEDIYINKTIRRDPYNLIWDQSVLPADVSLTGEFAGFIEIISRIELKRRLIYHQSTSYGYNTAQAMFIDSDINPLGMTASYYQDPPQVSELIQKNSPRTWEVVDWISWINGQRQGLSYAGRYEYVTIYARIIPSEHKMTAPEGNTPQIWKLCVVNCKKLVFAKRIISAYDVLPLLIGQPVEDGLSIQTQGIGELEMPYQDAASTLLSIRFNAARRAVSDRAIYDSTVLNPADVNAKTPAPKIPMRQNSLLGNKTIDQIYKAIPFDPRGTEGVIQDMGSILEFSRMLSGQNRPRMGEFQKGNKSVKEWSDTMSGSDNRMRLPALSLEYQFFCPMKEQIKINILQYGSAGVYTNIKTGEPVEITEEALSQIRKLSLQFKIADGYTPKSKLAGTEFLTAGMQMISASQPLQLAYGPALPGMFAHLMSLGGVKGLEEYIPEVQKPVGQTEAIPPATPQPGQS